MSWPSCRRRRTSPGRASKPGDVVKTIAGKTIEIYKHRCRRPSRPRRRDRVCPAACQAGGRHRYRDPHGSLLCRSPATRRIAMMGTGEALMDAIRKASEETSERVWRMPLYDECVKEYIKERCGGPEEFGRQDGVPRLLRAIS
ncbi:MAG: M17 family metallopeptidase [Desulfobacterales bacterium]|nr:M17 family metallopeptidase [Desulfobacterales bacterium]